MITIRRKRLPLLLILLTVATTPVFAAERSVDDVPIVTHPAVVKTTDVIVKTTPVWTEENIYWTKTYPTRPYYTTTKTYTTYEPAYKYGYEIYSNNNGVPFDELDQTALQEGWQDLHDADITWEEAMPAIRDSYTRVYELHHAPASVAPSAGTVTTKTTIIEKTTE